MFEKEGYVENSPVLYCLIKKDVAFNIVCVLISLGRRGKWKERFSRPHKNSNSAAHSD